MTETRAIEIITALGADPARWPADERAMVLTYAAYPAVAAALADAAVFDTRLTDWATADVAMAPFDSAGLIPVLRSVSSLVARRRGWAAAALAAALVAAAVVAPMPSNTPKPQIARSLSLTPMPPAMGEREGGDDAAFAYVFTPTVDEDALI